MLYTKFQHCSLSSKRKKLGFLSFSKMKQKDHRMTGQEPQPTGLLSEDEANQPITARAKKTKGAGSRSRDIGGFLNQQNLAIRNTPEQSSSSSRPSAEIYVVPHPPVSLLQPHPFVDQFLQGHPPSHLPQYLTLFQIPQHPGYHFPGVPFTPFPMNEADRQIQSTKISEKNQHQAPNICYPSNYPGSLGPWDPSYWRAQVPQLHPQHAYNIPGVYGFSSSQNSTVPNNSASLDLGSCSKRSVIKLHSKIPRKHRLLWEAQEAENVKLWTIVGLLQSEIAYNRSQMVKLEAEVSSLKQAAKEISAPVMKSLPSGKPLKRRGSKRSFGSVDALESSDERPPRARGREHLQRKAQKEGRAIIFKEVSPGNQEESSNPLSITQLEDRYVPHMVTHNCGEVDGKNVVMPSFENQFGPEKFQMPSTRVGTTSETKRTGDESKDVIVHDDLDVSSQHPEAVNDDIGNQVTTSAEGIVRTQ